MTHRPAPMVSVAICFLDEVRFLEGAVETVRAQTLEDWELLLLDDGSTDGSGAVAERAAAEDPTRVTVLRHPDGANRGLIASRNLALQHVRGAFTAFLDADDRWAPEKLERQVAAMHAAPELVMTCGASWYRREDGRTTRRPLTPDAPITFAAGAFARALVAGAVIPPPPSDVMYRTSALRDVGGVPSGLTYYEDQRTFVAVSLRGPVLLSDETLSTYAVRDDSMYGSVVDDRDTQREHRSAFKRWAFGHGIRHGPTGIRLSASIAVHEARVATGKAVRSVRRRLRR